MYILNTKSPVTGRTVPGLMFSWDNPGAENYSASSTMVEVMITPLDLSGPPVWEFLGIAVTTSIF